MLLSSKVLDNQLEYEAGSVSVFIVELLAMHNACQEKATLAAISIHELLTFVQIDHLKCDTDLKLWPRGSSSCASLVERQHKLLHVAWSVCEAILEAIKCVRCLMFDAGADVDAVAPVPI